MAELFKNPDHADPDRRRQLVNEARNEKRDLHRKKVSLVSRPRNKHNFRRNQNGPAGKASEPDRHSSTTTHRPRTRTRTRYRSRVRALTETLTHRRRNS